MKDLDLILNNAVGFGPNSLQVVVKMQHPPQV